MKNKFMLSLILAIVSAQGINAQKVYTLQDCRTMALQNNAKLKAARLNIESAKEQEREAKAKYLPFVSANGTYFHANDYLIKQNVSLSETDQQNIAAFMQKAGLDASALSSLPTSYTLQAIKHGTVVSLMAMEPIYAGGQITNGNRLAKLQTEVKQLMLQQSQDDVTRTTEVYYNQLLSLYEKQKTLDAVDKQLASIFNDADNAYKAGVSNKNDVLSVQLKQNDAAVSRLKLENGIKLSKMVLAQYIGVAGESIDIDRHLSENTPEPFIYFTDHKSALVNKTESQLLDRNVRANELQTKMKTGELLPTVAVGVAGVYQDMTNTGKAKAIGLATVSIPISDWWSNRGIKRQKIATEIARIDSKDNKELLLIQMQSAYDDLDNAYKQIQLAKKSIEQSTENLRLNEDYYKAGTANMTDLLNAQTKNQQSRDQYTEAVTLYLNCRTAYFIATGRSVK